MYIVVYIVHLYVNLSKLTPPTVQGKSSVLRDVALKLFVYRCSSTVLSNFASISPTKSCNNSLTIICSCWNKKSIPGKVSRGRLSISAWTWPPVLS